MLQPWTTPPVSCPNARAYSPSPAERRGEELDTVRFLQRLGLARFRAQHYDRLQPRRQPFELWARRNSDSHCLRYPKMLFSALGEQTKSDDRQSCRNRFRS